MFKEFKEFAMRGNVVDLAVGVIIGGAFGKIVTSAVNDIIMPPIGLLLGNVDFSDLKFIMKTPLEGAKAVTINYGAFVNNILDFVIVAFCVFLVVKAVNSMKKKEVGPPIAPTTKDCNQCLSKIPMKALKCAFCTSAQMILLGFLVLAPSMLRAEDAPAKAWKNATELSIVSANGNTRSQTGSGKNTFTYDWTRTKLELSGGALGARSEGRTTAERYFSSEKVEYKLDARNYLYEKGGWEKDRFAGIRSRLDGNAGVGRELFKTERNLLIGEVGAGYVNEMRTNTRKNDFISGRAYSKYVYTVSPTSNFSQDAEYLHNFEDKEDFRVNTETALTAAINVHFALKVSYVWKHVQSPPIGFGRNDTVTSVALVATY